MTNSYHIVGAVFVERRINPSELEIIGVEVVSSVPEAESKENFTTLVFDEGDVPSEPGFYYVMYAAQLLYYQDYWGEWDANSSIEWTKVIPVTGLNAKSTLEHFDCDSSDISEWVDEAKFELT